MIIKFVIPENRAESSVRNLLSADTTTKRGCPILYAHFAKSGAPSRGVSAYSGFLTELSLFRMTNLASLSTRGPKRGFNPQRDGVCSQSAPKSGIPQPPSL